MAQSKPLSTRQRVIDLRQSGHTIAQVSAELGVSPATIKLWSKRHSESADNGLHLRYSHCGRKSPLSTQTAFRLVRLLRHLHPTWGLGYLLARIKDRYPDLSLQSERTYYNRLGQGPQHCPRPTLPRQQAEPSRQVHDCWQIDAKERLDLADGTKACYLTVVDEASGAILSAEPFPPRTYLSGSSS
jgi:transposase